MIHNYKIVFDLEHFKAMIFNPLHSFRLDPNFLNAILFVCSYSIVFPILLFSSVFYGLRFEYNKTAPVPEEFLKSISPDSVKVYPSFMDFSDKDLRILSLALAALRYKETEDYEAYFRQIVITLLGSISPEDSYRDLDDFVSVEVKRRKKLFMEA